MKKYILVAIISLAAIAQLPAQHYRTAYFMEGSTMRSSMNPAFRPTRGYINIPVAGLVSVGLTSNSLAVDDLFYPDGNGNLMSFLNKNVSYDMLSENMRDKGAKNFDFDMRTSLLGFGFYSGKGFFDFGLDLRINGGFGLPQEIFEFIKKGSGREGGYYSMKNLSLALEATSVISAGYSYKILDNLTVGARFNYYAGLGRMDMKFDRFDLTLNGDEWKVDAVGVLDVIAKGAEVTTNEDGYIDLDNLGFKFKGLSGSGFSFDIGAEYKLFDMVTISAALLDFGMIKWGGDGAISAYSESQYSFSGFTIENGQFDDGFTGDIDEFLRFKKGESSDVKRTLRGKLVLGAELPLIDNLLSVGVVYTQKKGEFVDRHEVSAALTVRPASWVTASVSYSMDKVSNIGKSALNSLGMAVNFHTSFINVFVGTDYMLSRVSPQFIPLGQKVFSYYMGIAIPLAKGKY